MLKKFSVFGALALMLVGCAPLTRIALEPTTKKQLTEVNVRNRVWQDEVIVKAAAPNVSGAMGGGLIGAIIDSKISEGRQEKTQSIVEPFYASIDDVDFRQQFSTALNSALHDNFPVPISEIKTVVISDASENKDEIQKLPINKANFYLHTNYELSTDFSRLNIITSAALAQGGNSDKPVYFNVFDYQSSSVGTGGENSIQEWSANKGEKYRLLITEGVAQIIKMLKIDISLEAADLPNAKVVNLQKMIGSNLTAINGKILDEQANRSIIRSDSDNRVYSLPH